MNKILTLLKIIIAIVKRPKNLLKVISPVPVEDYFKEHLEKSYGLSELKTVDILDIVPNFDETIDPYSFLDGTSMVIEIALLKILARTFPKCQYLEIGSWRGESIVNVAEVASECVSITLSEKEMREMNILENFIKVHGFFSKGVQNIINIGHNSATFNFSTLNRKFDLIFVDGDHSYNGVTIDTGNVFKLLKDENSIIVWHDCGFGIEDTRYSVVAGILDGAPKEYRDKIYRVSNTKCGIFLNKEIEKRSAKFYKLTNKSFSVKIRGEWI